MDAEIAARLAELERKVATPEPGQLANCDVDAASPRYRCLEARVDRRTYQVYIRDPLCACGSPYCGARVWGSRGRLTPGTKRWRAIVDRATRDDAYRQAFGRYIRARAG